MGQKKIGPFWLEPDFFRPDPPLAKAEKQLQSLMINTAFANRLTTKPLENGLMSARPNNDYSSSVLW